MLSFVLAAALIFGWYAISTAFRERLAFLWQTRVLWRMRLKAWWNPQSTEPWTQAECDAVARCWAKALEENER